MRCEDGLPRTYGPSTEGVSLNRSTRALALAASVLTIALVIAAAVLYSLNGLFSDDPVAAVMLVGVACYGAIGGVVAWRIPRNACGWLLLAIGAGLAAALCTDGLTMVALEDGRTTLASWSDWFNAVLFFPVLSAIPLYLLVFPTGAPPSPRWRPAAVALIVIAIAGALVAVVGPSGDEVENPILLTGLASLVEALRTALTVAFLVMVMLSVASVVVRWRGAAAEERSQLRWLVIVAVLAASLLIGSIAAGILGIYAIADPLGILCILVVTTGLPASAGIALLRHRLHGIEVVANRSIVYGSLAALITALYAAIVAGIGGAVGRGDRPNVIAAVVATAVAAVIFQPARRQAQRVADRLIYGDRASPYELLATFSERLEDASLDEVLPRMTSLIGEGTGAQRVRIWLRDGNELRVVAAWPAGETPAPSVPLDGGELPTFGDPAFAVRYGSELLGAFTVRMPPQEPMTPATERLFADLSAQAAMVLRNAALVDELQQSLQRLVTSHDEARRRMERDLHDGAQQRLVTLSMNLQVARTRAGASGDAELATTLDAAEQELARSLAELRELARGIHPAILTQNGVGAAVRSLADRSTVPVEVASVPDGRYPPDIEATAYFVVSEALANVVKHADASRVWVRVADDDGQLAIEVQDDGVGGATVGGGGSGLRGLADRVKAVGGRLDVRSRPGSGSVVHAEIPCASR